MVGNIVPGRQDTGATRDNAKSRRGDAAVLMVGGTLAAASAVFAAYMIVAGPFPASSGGFSLIKLAGRDAVERPVPPPSTPEADPVITGTITQDPALTRPEQIPSWFNAPGRPVNYRLKSVVRRKAFVDISSGSEKFTWAVEPGGLMPGIGAVGEISQDNGKWVVRTGRVRISERGVELAPDQ